MTTITIDKTTYIAATNVGPNASYAGLLTNNIPKNDRMPNAVKFAFDASFNGECFLEIDYASEQPRPVHVFFNGKLVSRNALLGATGGWTRLLRTGISLVPVLAGANTIVIQRSSAIPHLGNLFVVRTDSETTDLLL